LCEGNEFQPQEGRHVHADASAIIAAGPGKPAEYTLLSGVFIMEMPALPLGSRRNEDIALDLMKFVAMTTGYGKTIGTGVGFQGGGAAAKPEDYAAHLLELYRRCLQSVSGK
jgi:hypothetical protein